jgi:hypothetical protein
MSELHLNNTKNTFCTSLETHYISTEKPNRLMLFGETAAVCSQDHTKYVVLQQVVHIVTTVL